MPIKTALIDLLGIEHPIICGGMQYVGYAEMAAAVSNAGGLGVLTGLTQPSPDDLRKEIARCRTMTKKPFGVNLTILPALIPADYDAYAQVVAESKVALCEIAGGSPRKYMKLFHDNGVKVLHKSATLRHALKAQACGVDLIEIVGYGASIAGGQPGDEIGLWVALAKAISRIKNIPIIASGASGTGRQLAAALAMGACGITMATRFLATREAPVSDAIKKRLVEATERDTTVVLDTLYNATRVFKNSVAEKIKDIERDPDFDGDFRKIAPLASGKRSKRMWRGDLGWDAAMWSCGQSVGLIDDIPTCKDLICRIVSDAEAGLKRGASCVVVRSQL